MNGRNETSADGWRSQRFSDGPCIHTLLVYLAYYKDFTDDEQMKRAVNLLHRAAIRAKSEGLFFKVSPSPQLDQSLSTDEYA